MFKEGSFHHLLIADLRFGNLFPTTEKKRFPHISYFKYVTVTKNLSPWLPLIKFYSNLVKAVSSKNSRNCAILSDSIFNCKI